MGPSQEYNSATPYVMYTSSCCCRPAEAANFSTLVQDPRPLADKQRLVTQVSTKSWQRYIYIYIYIYIYKSMQQLLSLCYVGAEQKGGRICGQGRLDRDGAAGQRVWHVAGRDAAAAPARGQKPPGLCGAGQRPHLQFCITGHPDGSPGVSRNAYVGQRPGEQSDGLVQCVLSPRP